ncbi:MAG: response regulator [Myxococcales bacterium]|nr:response regulator [Myxococcales bacterium]
MRKKMENSIALSDRMASLGISATGVGHEINNPLTYVFGSIDFVIEELEPKGAKAPASLVSPLLDAKEGAERVRDIVTDLCLFARPASELEAEIELSAVIRQAITMASHEVSLRARLVTEFGDTPPVVGVEGQFGQVVLNLLVNAAQAIAPGAYDIDKISLRTYRRDHDKVVIEIGDTGAGLSPAALARLFEPFFTTKSATGTGLGLSISHRIVEAMGGTIEVESEEPQGTTFRAVLPSVEEDSLPAARKKPSERISSPGVANILVVDNQSAVLDLLVRILGREALELIEKQDFNLVLCDLMMPDITGTEVHEQLRRTDPEQARRMAFITGGVSTEGAQEFLDSHSSAFLPKPFSANSLRALIAKQLELPV